LCRTLVPATVAVLLGLTPVATIHAQDEAATQSPPPPPLHKTLM
jgi:hypothetical protein